MPMEGATDPKMLEDRVFFKMGLLIHDRSRIMISFGLISCILMGSLITIGADWAESFGEDDVESMHAWDLLSERFATENDEGGPSFRYIVYHPMLNDSDDAWQLAVRTALSEFENHPEISIEYSWDVEEAVREDVIVSDSNGTYAINQVSFTTDRKESFSYYESRTEPP